MSARPRFSKQERISIRVSSNLKAEYEAALIGQGVSMTDHLTQHILNFLRMENRKKRAIERANNQEVNK